MARRKMPVADDGMEGTINLTPMIDVTFQLLIFFIVTSEFSKLDMVEGLQLPKADVATPDVEPAKDRLVITVAVADRDKGTVKYMVGGDERSMQDLQNLVYREATRSKDSTGFSSRPVLIRADKDVAYQHVQKVMNMLMNEQIWKMSFGAEKKEDVPPK
jgi:biopolymer transport protein ExbD